LWIEPGPEGSIHGFEKWQVYREEWVYDRNEKYYLCAVVFEFEGTPTADACAGCSESWAVATEFSETDCDESTAASPAFATLSAIGLGEVDPDLPLETPFDEALGSWARFGDTAWESHGWAYPSVAGQGGEPPQWNWNSSQPFDLIPAWTWPLDEQTP